MANSASKKIAIKPNLGLPPIPDKLYFSIGEAAKLCDIKTHVLRYWEEEFPPLSPTKRRGNRRFYQRKDVMLVREIRNLLYIQGFTIEGAKAQLASNKKETQISTAPKEDLIKKLLADLENVLEDLVVL